MALVINGTAVRWALPGFTLTAVGKLIQTAFDQTKMDEPETIKNSQGVTVTRIWPDPSDELTFSGFVTGSSLSDAKTQALLVANGTEVDISYTAGDYAGFTSASKGEVQSGKISTTNTSAMKVDITIRIWPAITSFNIS